jgi:ABC-type transport system substrate-binding protein
MRSISRRNFLTGALTAAPALLLPRLQSARPPLTIAMPALTDSLDPHMASARRDWLVIRQVFDTLVEYSENSAIQPALAESWTLDETGATFTLRADVTFHNGAPFDADAVVFNVERILADHPGRAALRALMGDIAGARALDPRTVRIVTRAPDPLLLRRLTHLAIAAPGSDDMRYRAVGTGAYMAGEYRPNRYLDLIAFPQGWRGIAQIESARLIAIDDPQRMLGALQRGEADILADTPTDFLAGIARIYPVAVRTDGTCVLLRLNTDAQPLLSTPDVQNALTLAMDRRFIAQIVYSGFADPAGQIAPPGYPDHDPAITPPDYDRETALALLAEARIADWSLTISGKTAWEQGIAGLVIEFLNAVGIQAEWAESGALMVETLDFAALRDTSGVDHTVIPLVHPQIAYPLSPGVDAAVAPDGVIRLRDITRR